MWICLGMGGKPIDRRGKPRMLRLCSELNDNPLFLGSNQETSARRRSGQADLALRNSMSSFPLSINFD